jgi:hypothetical protein
MVDKAVAFFYQGESSEVPHPPDARQSAHKFSRNYSCQYEVVNESNSQDFEVSIPRADLDSTGKGFMVTCSNEEALKLIKDSAVIVGQVVEMLGVDMYLW